MPANSVIQLRRGTAAQWTSANPVLEDGEPGYEKDTGKEKRGDGTTAWTSLAYFAPGTAAADITINVKDYGATGNGSTNDTTAVAAAIAALTPGATLTFPAGSYVVSQVLLASKADFRIVGASASLIGSDQTKAVLRLTSCSRFEIVGLDISHSSATVRNSTGYGIDLRSATDYLVSGCRVHGVASAGIFSQIGTRGTVFGCTVRDNLADGIHHTGGSRNIDVIGNHLHTTGDDAIAVVSYQTDAQICGDVSITGNVVVQSKARGITVVGGQNVTISGNTVRDTSLAGIYAAQENSFSTYGVLNVSIIGNTIVNPNTYNSPSTQHAGVHVAGGSSTYPVSGVLVSSNQIFGAAWRMIEVVATTADQVTNVVVSNNFCDGPNTTSAGIQFDNVTQSAIVRNTVRNAAGSGIAAVTGCDYVSTDMNNVFFPNQGGGAASYGVLNQATHGSSALNVVTPDSGKTALLAQVQSTDTSGTVYAQRNIQGVQVVATSAPRGVILTGASTRLALRSDGGVAWSVSSDAGGGTLDTALIRDSAGVLRVSDNSGTSTAGVIRTGRGATASRPSASTVGTDAMWYDTDLHKPIWSDGTNWRDAAGTTV